MQLNIQDTSLFVEDVGQGLPIMLIHGFPLNHEMWHPQITSLSAFSRVIAVDLRGHGQSPATEGTYSMDLLADDCARVLEVLQVKKPAVICGLSMGGYISFALYRRHPEKVAGLILAATRAVADSLETKNNRDKAVQNVIQSGPEAVIESMLPSLLAAHTFTESPELVSRIQAIMSQTSRSGMISALIGMKNRSDSTDILRDIHVPTLILQGAEDQIIPLTESKSMQAEIPQSELKVIPRAGHLLNMEQVGLFNQSVEDFLRLRFIG